MVQSEAAMPPSTRRILRKASAPGQSSRPGNLVRGVASTPISRTKTRRRVMA